MKMKMKKTNFLLYSVRHDISIKMIDYIIEECGYETLNFGKHAYHSPLYQAILKENFELANYFMDNGADINYKHFDMDEKKFFKYLYKNSFSFKKVLIFILNKGFTIDAMTLHQLINEKAIYNNWALETILQHIVYNPNFILNLLSLYHTQQPLNQEQFKNLLWKERTKIIINKDMYEAAIYKKNYEAIRILHEYSYRSKEVNLGYLFGLLESFDRRNKTHRKKDFITGIKNNKLKLRMEKRIVESMDKSEMIRQDIKNIILSGTPHELKKYISEMAISIAYLNTNEFDILIYAIDNKVPFKMIDYIIHLYGTLDLDLDYFITKDGMFYASPLSIAIGHENFSVADELLKNRADINAPIHNLSYYDEYDNVLDFLYKRNLYNPRNLKYLLNNDIRLTTNMIHQLIYNNEIKLLTLIFRNYLFNTLFILELLSIYRNKKPLTDRQLYKKLEKEVKKIKFNSSMYEKAIINGHYEIFILLLDNDNRGSTLVLNEIFEILYSKGFEYEKQLFKANIEKYVSTSSLGKELVGNLENVSEKRKEVFGKIRRNDVKELRNYLESNRIILWSLNTHEHDLLLDSIESDDVSLEMIEFIIKYYKTLNYVVNFGEQYKTPLLMAISKNNFKLANLLLKNDAYINYEIEKKENLFYYLCHYGSVNKKNVMYVIKNGIEISFYAVNSLMQNYSIDILKIIYRHYIFNNHFIIKILSLYKKSIPLSNKTLNAIISKEKGKLLIDEMDFKEIYINKE
eukprot:jgi/Orpsp1_1/1175941/evm.model.c7180000055814.1